MTQSKRSRRGANVVGYPIEGNSCPQSRDPDGTAVSSSAFAHAAGVPGADPYASVVGDVRLGPVDESEAMDGAEAPQAASVRLASPSRTSIDHVMVTPTTRRARPVPRDRHRHRLATTSPLQVSLSSPKLTTGS
jgi:hypothetical protein